MVDVECARKAVLARFRARMDRLASLLSEAMTAAEGAVPRTERADRPGDSAREARSRSARAREPQRRTG